MIVLRFTAHQPVIVFGLDPAAAPSQSFRLTFEGDALGAAGARIIAVEEVTAERFDPLALINALLHPGL